MGGDAAGHRDEGFPIWIGGRQGDLDTGFEFLDANGDFAERPAERFECRLAPKRAAGRGLAKPMQQPVSAGMQEEPELVGLPTGDRTE